MLRSVCFLTSRVDLTKPRSRVMSTFVCSAARSGSYVRIMVAVPLCEEPLEVRRLLGQASGDLHHLIVVLGINEPARDASVSSKKSTSAGRFLSMNGLRAVHTIMSVTPMASRWANSVRAILRSFAVVGKRDHCWHHINFFFPRAWRAWSETVIPRRYNPVCPPDRACAASRAWRRRWRCLRRWTSPPCL